jgi:hypothetical protein
MISITVFLLKPRVSSLQRLPVLSGGRLGKGIYG